MLCAVYLSHLVPGNPNPKKEFKAGPGWVPFGDEIARSTKQRDSQEDREDSATPSTAEAPTTHSDSQSDAYEVTPESEEQKDESRSVSFASDVDSIRESKVEHPRSDGYFELEETAAMVPGEDWRPVQNPVLKADPASEPLTISIGTVPTASVNDISYYAPIWNGNVPNVEQTPTAYEQAPQYSNVPPQWFSNNQFSQAPQQSHLSSCSTARTPNGMWSEYRPDLGPFQPVANALPMQNQYAGLDSMQQMAVSPEFAQATVKTTSDAQTPVYGVPMAHYAASFESHGSSGGYLGSQHQGMYSRWP